MTRLPMPDVVVLLPGIMGSILKRGSEVVWGFSAGLLAKALLTAGAKIRDDLTLSTDSEDMEDLGDGIVADSLIPDLHLLPGFWKIDGYSRVAQTLRDRFELESRVNYFEFPYDWRRSNAVTGRQLAAKCKTWLERRRRTVSDAKLVLIAHSMGGIVSRWFIEKEHGWRDTRALITFGTPYRGSLNALDALSGGMHKGPMGMIDLSEMARSFTSIYQLLPIYPCYDPGDQNLVRVGETFGIPNVMPEKAAAALKFHTDIRRAVDANLQDPEYLAYRYSVHPIVGIRQDTNLAARHGVGKVELLKTAPGQELGGDGTVPRVSATPIEYSDARNEMFAATQHGSLQNDDATLEQVCGLLADLRTDLGTFRKAEDVEAESAAFPPALGSVSISVQDIYWRDEPVEIRARSNRPGASLSALISRDNAPEKIAQIPLVEASDGTCKAQFVPPSEGGYRVRIVGGSAVEPAEDSFAVAPVKESPG